MVLALPALTWEMALFGLTLLGPLTSLTQRSPVGLTRALNPITVEPVGGFCHLPGVPVPTTFQAAPEPAAVAVAVVVTDGEPPVAVRVAVPPTPGTLIDGRLMRPLASLVPLADTDPPANVYPFASDTVTATPAAGTPPFVAVTYAPVIVEHAVPE